MIKPDVNLFDNDVDVIPGLFDEDRPELESRFFEDTLKTQELNKENQLRQTFLQEFRAKEEAKRRAADPANWTFEQMKQNFKQAPAQSIEEEAKRELMLEKKKAEKDAVKQNIAAQFGVTAIPSERKQEFRAAPKPAVRPISEVNADIERFRQEQAMVQPKNHLKNDIAMLAKGISEDTGMPFPEVIKNFPKVARAYAQSKGLPNDPTFKDLIGAMSVPLMATAFTSLSLGKLALGVAGYTGAQEAVNLGVSKAKGDKYQPFAGRSVSELLPPESPQLARDFVDALEEVGKIAVSAGVVKAAPKMAEKITRQLITDYKLPTKVRIDSKEIKSIFQTGENISKEKTELFKALELKPSQLRQAIDNGLTIDVPAEKVVTMSDRPWFAKVKKIFKVAPGETTVRTDIAGKPVTGPAAELASPESMAIKESSIHPDTALHVKNLPAGGELGEIPAMRNTADAIAYGRRLIGNKDQILKLVEERNRLSKEATAIFNNPASTMEDMNRASLMSSGQAQFLREAIEAATNTGSNKMDLPRSLEEMKADVMGQVAADNGQPEAPSAGGIVHDLTPAELEQAKKIDPDGLKGVNLNRDITVKDLQGNEKHYKKGESIFIYQDPKTGKAIVKDGDWGVLPNRSVQQVQQAGKAWGEYAPEMKGLGEVVKVDKPMVIGQPMAGGNVPPKPEGLSAKAWQVDLPYEPTTNKRVNKVDILRHIEKSFDVPIRGFTTVKKRIAEGLYYPHQDLVRLKKWGELEVATHEIAHRVDHLFKREVNSAWRNVSPQVQNELKALDYDQKKRRTSEGFAEFMRHYLTVGDAYKVAPQFNDFLFNKFLPKHPKIEKSITDLKGMYDTWKAQGAEARLQSQIEWKKEFDPKKSLAKHAKDAFDWTERQFFEEYSTLRKSVEEIEKQSGKKIRPSKNPYELAVLYRSKAGAIVNTFVEKNAIDFTGNPVGESLNSILKDISPKDQKKFFTYWVAKRAQILQGRAKETGFDTQDIQGFLGKNANPAWDDKVTRLTKWSDSLMNWVIEAGGLSEDDAKVIRELNPVYVMFKRIFTEETPSFGSASKLGDRAKAIKGLKGSARPILNPYEASVGAAREMVANAIKMKVGSALADLSKYEGSGRVIAEVPAPVGSASTTIDLLRDPMVRELLERLLKAQGLDLKEGVDAQELADKVKEILPEGSFERVVTSYFAKPHYTGKDNVISIWKDGKRKFYEVDKDLYRSIQELDSWQLPKALVPLSWFNKLLRLGAITFNPAFIFARNPFRDSITYYMQSQQKNPIPFVDTMIGLLREKTQENKPGSLINRYKNLGGEMSGFIGSDRQMTMKVYDKFLTRELSKFGKALWVAKDPVDSLQSLLSFFEQAPRVVELERMYEQYKKEHPEWSDDDRFIAAMNDAQNSTLNFSGGGKTGKKINAVSAFFNSQLLGLGMIGKTFKQHPGRTLMRGMAISALTIALWQLNRRKQWYKNLPREYKYANYFVETPKGIVRLPKPFEWGTLFGSTFEAGLDYMEENDPKSLDAFMSMAGRSIPTPEITALAPWWDIARNKDYLNRPIESEGMKFLPPQARVRENTSEASKIIVDSLASMGFDKSLSPVQLDYLLNSYTGGFYRNVSPGGVIRSLTVANPDKPARQTQDFYDELDDLSAKKELGTIDRYEMDRLKTLNRMKGRLSLYRKALKKYKETGREKALPILYRNMQKELSRIGFGDNTVEPTPGLFD